MPGVETTLQECRRTGAISADSEAERHSVAVRPAVRIGRIHRGAMGKPSGINSFKSEDPCSTRFKPVGVNSKSTDRRQELTLHYLSMRGKDAAVADLWKLFFF